MIKLFVRNSKPLLMPLLVVALAALAACGGDDGGGGTPTPEATSEASPTSGATSTPHPSGTPGNSNAPLELSDFTIKPSVTRAPPGTVNFMVTNAGPSIHEFVVVKSDLPIAELPRLPGEKGADESKLDVVGRIEPIAPGGTGQVSLQLEEGKYVLICNLAPADQSHYLNGMYEQFVVEFEAHQPVATPIPITTPTPKP